MLSFLKANFKISSLFCLACFLGPALITAADVQARVLHRGVVTAHKLNIRTLPQRGAPVVVVLDRGEDVDVLEAGEGPGGWLLVSYYGEQGYVRNRSEYIALIKPGDLSAGPKAVETPGVPDPPVKIKRPAPLKKKDKSALRASRKTEAAARAKKEVIKKQIEEETLKVVSFSKKEMEIFNGLNAIDFSLNQARVKAGNLKRETRALTLEIEGIQGRMSDLGKVLKKNQTYAGSRLNALYRMHMMGSLEMAGPPASLFDFFIKQKALKRVVASDFTVLEKQTADLNELNRLEAELQRQMASRAALEEQFDIQIRIQETESRKKSVILGEIREKKKLAQAALASLKSSAEELDKTLHGMGGRGRSDLDNASFVRQKGRLALPVPGKIISRYGKEQKGDYKSFTFQSGIDIRVERGEPVHSVFKGEVMFAQWLKGYGNLVIINHGDNYYTLYAHVDALFKKKGEQVGTGEVIATAGDTGSIKGLCLHFEVRHHGKPVNPMKWLKKGA